ncbi:MAG: polymorphic toxin-type HINT domain-containing protein [Chloroflexota bacterium]|nr:polymorphic toxin-type HINT domain-containing protein [Chloroflexota bacterium]
MSSFNNPASGAVMQGNQLYGPYGNQRLKQGSLSTNKGFTGQYNDGLTGLDYYHARYYDPTIGLFLSADTVQGNAKGMDPYSYVGGNPETRTDPTGTRMLGPDGSLGWINPFTNELTTYILPQAHSVYTAQLQTRPLTTQAPYDPLKDQANSPQAKLGRSTGLSTLLNPKASAGDKLKALWHGLNNLLMAAGFFMGGPEADAGVAAADGVIEGSDGLLGGIEEALRSCEGGLSFTPSTKVATAHGEQGIGTVRPGEKVWAYNPKTRKMELQPILHVWINYDNDLVDLTITSTHASHGKASKTTQEVIHTNKKHPFLTVEKGFLPVGHITLGMHVVEADGQVGVITGWKVVPGVKTMYNLEVAQDHTFTVGAGQWVVHNCDGLGKLTNLDLKVSEDGLNQVIDHLSKDVFSDPETGGIAPENQAMISRLQNALAAGKTISGADASFYMHELYESTLMNRGVAYDVAHDLAIGRYGVSPYSIYHPDVIQAFPEFFNSNWFSFWGMR